MITITAVWLCLITDVVYGTIITVNNNGNDSVVCCSGNETCPCSSLSSALHNMSDNTLINITSESVTLHDIVGMGSGNLNNITITGNGATIMCNNTGGVYCESCSDVTIIGITWHQCGGKNLERLATQTPVLDFSVVSNVLICNCKFQGSSGCPININSLKGSIIISGSLFMDAIFDSPHDNFNCGGLQIHSDSPDVNITIISSGFYTSGYGLSKSLIHYGAIIVVQDYCESLSVVIESAEFSNNHCGLYLFNACSKSAMIQMSNISVHNNTAYGILISTSDANANGSSIKSSLHIVMSFVTLMDNVNPLGVVTPLHLKQLQVMINISNSTISHNTANGTGLLARKLGVLQITLNSFITMVTIVNCHFYNNFNGAVGIHLAPSLDECGSSYASIKFTNVTINSTVTTNDSKYNNIASVSVVTVNIITSIIEFTDVSFLSNNYLRYKGEVLLIENHETCEDAYFYVLNNLINCTFDNNTAVDRVVFLNIKTETTEEISAFYKIQLTDCNFNNNSGGKSIVQISYPTSNLEDASSVVRLSNSVFSNNKGSTFYLAIAQVLFAYMVLFTNNTANSGPAIYFEEVHGISSINADVQFINNSAVQRGGALYFNLVTDCSNMFSVPFNATCTFINNSANIAGNSIYFSISHICHIITNTSDNSSLLYIPNKFNYFQAFYIIGSPVVTSPYNIKFYPPALAIHNSSNDYFIKESKMLGEPIQFNTSVLDYFNESTEPVIFSFECKTCVNDYALSTHQITAHNYSLNEFKVFSKTARDVISKTNISITLQSVLTPNYKSISASLLIELSSCRTGYLFDKSQRQCICYPYSDVVHCTEQYSEIKIGYWIGFLTEQQYTSSICPSSYCNFPKRTETSLGYYNLPSKPDDQCSSHRTGVACGECKPGYTLAYDSPDCINTDKCTAGMTILVIMLTILYWIAIVAAVFGLMYFQFQISSGYAYGIIYYYSIVDIVLGNEISEEVFRAVAILSSFAKLTPQLFGEFCLVKGLSGIDQQFIHYSHALAVSLILLIIVLVTKYSPRLALYVRRYIICVICLLLLLSYTSLASTSLQLLRPLTFNDVDEVRTYSSPDIKYFTGRHLAYAIVAILCEVIIVIGLPVFLLLEPLLGRAINFVKIKPLLDQFQGCYKDKYRWFAVYYLICRQVIILIVYVGNGDYYNKLYYLQTACIIIAMIHGWVQPYKNKLVNGLDIAILLTLVLVVNLNTFSFLSPVSSRLTIILIILPLLLLCLIVVRKLIIHCYNRRKKMFYLYSPVVMNEEFEESEENDNNDNEANDIRFVFV